MIHLSEDQVHAFRLSRSLLHEKNNEHSIEEITRLLCGAQAQVLSAGLMSVGLRQECSKQQMLDALYKDRSIVKTWAMRGTLYLISSNDLPYYATAYGERAVSGYQSHLENQYKVKPKDTLKLLESLEKNLGTTPMTKRELSALVADELGDWVKEYIENGWGGSVRMLCKMGVAVFAENRGQEVTFIRRDAWLKNKWKNISSDNARRYITRQFISTYGPCDASDLKFYLGMYATHAKEYWDSIKDEITEIKVGHKKLWLLDKDVSELQNSSFESDTISFLPHFDNYLLAHRKKEHLVPAKHYKSIYRIAGWVTPTILHNGKVIGTWEYKEKNGITTIRMKLLGKQPKELKYKVKNESLLLSSYFDSKIRSSYTG
jgi:hypothetical protein